MIDEDIDLSCDTCGKPHKNAGTVEEAIENGMDANAVQWICHECGSPATARRDVDEL
jgi:RNase P subunit RPR2